MLHTACPNSRWRRERRCPLIPSALSKTGLRGRYSTSLRQELSLLEPPVDVVVLNPGAMATPMLTNQGSGGPNAFMEAAARRPGTHFAPFLLRGQRLAEAYIARNTQPPELVASAVEEIIHRGTRKAPRRCVIGASPEMRFVVRYLPQWVLDAATRAQLVGKG